MAKTFSLQVASVVIEQDGKFLLVQEAQQKAYGKWNWPGGHLDPGETHKQAAAREALEEAGYEVEVGKELVVIDRPKDDRQLHAFSAVIVGGEPMPQTDEILDVAWFSYEEIKAMETELRSPDYIFLALEKYLSQ